MLEFFFFLFFLAVMTKFVQQVFGFNLKGLGVVVNRIVVVKVLLQYKDFGFQGRWVIALFNNRKKKSLTVGLWENRLTGIEFLFCFIILSQSMLFTSRGKSFSQISEQHALKKASCRSQKFYNANCYFSHLHFRGSPEHPISYSGFRWIWNTWWRGLHTH